MTVTSYTRIFSSSFLIIAITLLANIGCSSRPDPSQPIYDTAANPDNFPSPALTLLNMIESDQLSSYNQITAGFGDLYMAHSELLDNIKWRETIDRLGGRLHYRAEKYASEGPDKYDRAADFYRIAAFAQPDDTSLQNKASMFTVWSEAIEKELLDGWDFPDTTWSLEYLINIICRLAPDDENDRKFIYEYLMPFADLPDEAALHDELSAMNLTFFQQAILNSIGMPVEFSGETLATFSLPDIDLIAFHLDSLPAHSHRLTLCFRPGEQVEYDLFVETYQRITPLLAKDVEFIEDFTHIFRPDQPSKTWKPGQIAVVNGWPCKDDHVALLKVGLFSQQLDQKHFLSINESKDNRYTIRVYPQEK